MPSVNKAVAVVAISAAALGSASPHAAADPVMPTVVMVHGAWADTFSWDGELALLTARGYTARAIANPLAGLLGDAATVRTFIDSLPAPVVLVGHSYGGAVITEAAADAPNVKALVYVDAAAPDVGETNGSLSGENSVLKTLPDTQLFDRLPDPGGPPGAAELYLKRTVFLDHFGDDLPAAVANGLWASQRGASTAAFDTPATKAAWRTIPSWYFISSGDEIITPTAEHAMATRARSTVTTFSGGSHLTLISHPDAVTAVIQQAIDALR